MQGNGYEGRNCTLFVAGVSVIFNTVGKNAPHVQFYGPCVSILSPTNSSADFAKVNGMFDDFGVNRNQLKE